MEKVQIINSWHIVGNIICIIQDFMQGTVLKKKKIPHRFEAVYNKTSSIIKCKDESHADFLFIKAAQRLLDINNWGNYSTKIPWGFCLTDLNGNIKNESAREGYKIFIRRGGEKTGKWYSWVKIVHVEYFEKEKNEAVLVMQVGSLQKLSIDPERTASFFNDYADSSFLLSRNGLNITCSLLKKNEKNPVTRNWKDKIIGFLRSLFEYFNFYKLDWRSFTKGILSYSKKEKSIVE